MHFATAGQSGEAQGAGIGAGERVTAFYFGRGAMVAEQGLRR